METGNYRKRQKGEEEAELEARKNWHRSPLEIQKLQLEKLMADPSKTKLPEPTKEEKPKYVPPDIINHVPGLVANFLFCGSP